MTGNVKYLHRKILMHICMFTVHFVAMCYMSTQNKHLHVQVIKTTFAQFSGHSQTFMPYIYGMYV